MDVTDRRFRFVLFYTQNVMKTKRGNSIVLLSISTNATMFRYWWQFFFFAFTCSNTKLYRRTSSLHNNTIFQARKQIQLNPFSLLCKKNWLNFIKFIDWKCTCTRLIVIGKKTPTTNIHLELKYFHDRVNDLEFDFFYVAVSEFLINASLNRHNVDVGLNWNIFLCNGRKKRIFSIKLTRSLCFFSVKFIKKIVFRIIDRYVILLHVFSSKRNHFLNGPWI